MNDNFDYKADLRKRLPELKKIEGFPIGDDEDILALSNPPFYTVCPNPYINEFIEKNGKPYNDETDEYLRNPFVGDVSESKNDIIYNAHSYHTKVPYKAILKYVEHYTDTGDLILDGFSGTGMTGIASQMSNRKAILADLSPFATFISHVYNSENEPSNFEMDAKNLLIEVENECAWMYETKHNNEDINNQLYIYGHEELKGKINFTVWSEVFYCPFCNNEIIFHEIAINKNTGDVLSEFNCNSCNALLKKNDCKRVFEEKYDDYLKKKISIAKQVPVLIN